MRWRSQHRRCARTGPRSSRLRQYGSQLSRNISATVKIISDRISFCTESADSQGSSLVFCVNCIVKYFTFNTLALHPGYAWSLSAATAYKTRVPSRTVRRVHVSPLSTTIRHIARLRAGACGGDDDGSGGLRLRR
jgi:hypothetical protein